MGAVNKIIQVVPIHQTSAAERWSVRVKKFYPYLYLFPFLAFFVVFQIYPIFFGFYVSLTKWDLSSPAQFVGLANYINTLTKDTLFYTAVRNTIVFVALNAPLVIVIALGMAILVNDSIPGRAIFRSAFSTPLMISVSSVGVLWVWFFNPVLGLINYYLGLVGLPGPNWLASSPWAMFAVVVTTVWWTCGFNMILFLAGIQDIPDHLYEAAKIDGAGNWSLFRHITLPGLRATLLFVGVTTVIGSFRVFAQVFVMTQGGPYDSTRTIVEHLYDNAFNFFRFGNAAAIGWLLFAGVVIFTLVQFRLLKERD